MSYDCWDRPPRPGSRFAHRLRRIRAGAALTPQQLADKAGLDLASYYAFETGQANVTAVTLMRLARAMKIAPSVFFDPD